MTPTQTAVLEQLRASGGFVSGEALARPLGISRAGVAKAVAGLRSLGYAIESTPHLGHRLTAAPDLLLPEELLQGIETRALGRLVVHERSMESTQSRSRTLAENGAAHGTLVVAEVQTAGRGRLGRRYSSPPGGVWCTVILRGPLAFGLVPLVGLAAGAAMATAISRCTGLPATLKWPNDVLVAERKVAGILVELAAEEQRLSYMLVGSGVNANVDPAAFPHELRDRATSLQAEGTTVDRAALVRAYLTELERLYERLLADEPECVIDAWRRHPSSCGRRVRVERSGQPPLEGRAVDLDARGALLVETAAGEVVAVPAGEVLHARVGQDPGGGLPSGRTGDANG